MALVDILVDVFDGLDRCHGLEIDLATILPDEISTVSDDPAIVNLLSMARALSWLRMCSQKSFETGS